MKSPRRIISLIGRPNVGKSSVFNVLMRKQNLAITHDMPGVTRDRHYGMTSIEEKEVILVDTGGFYPEKIEESADNSFFNLMADHARLAVEESDIILFVVDVREGMLPFDERIFNVLRGSQKPVLVVVNKVDSHNQVDSVSEFFTLGVNEEELYPVSAAHALGFIELRESLVDILNKWTKRTIN